jgi:hypothetical protein
MKPFAYVFYVEHDNDEHYVSVHSSLDEAEEALRAYAAAIFVDGESLADSEIADILMEYNEHVRIFACTVKRGVQISTQLSCSLMARPPPPEFISAPLRPAQAAPFSHIVRRSTVMTQRMEAEILFDDQAAADAASAVLVTRGFTIERLRYVDEFEGFVLTPTVWIKVTGASELDEHAFFREMAQLAEQFNGDVCEAGLADPPLRPRAAPLLGE